MMTKAEVIREVCSLDVGQDRMFVLPDLDVKFAGYVHSIQPSPGGRWVVEIQQLVDTLIPDTGLRKVKVT